MIINVYTDKIQTMGDIYTDIIAFRHLWELPPKPVFHHLASLICSQEVSFNIGRHIRHKLYDLASHHNKEGIVTPNFIVMYAHLLPTTGLSVNRIETLVAAAKLTIASIIDYHVEDSKCTVNDVDLLDNQTTYDLIDNYKAVKGIGPWTISGLKVLTQFVNNNTSKTVSLHMDKWIRQRVSELVGKPSILSEKDVLFIFNSTWPNHQTLMSYFLWRIKSSGITKMLTGVELTQDDFV
jgi:3-methyladenine DNA glycosylase/8-oxoguanine DNA glycosylase